MPDGPWPGSGAVLAAVEEATGRRAERTVGKPEPDMYATARDRLGAGRYLAVGDRLDIDVAGARRAGIDSALVLTGVTTQRRGRRAPTRARRTSPTRSPRSCWLTLAFAARPAPALPHRQPQRRPRPRGAAAARASRRRCARAGSRSGSSARTRSPTRASWRATRSRAGEVAAGMGGDGLLGAIAGELRGTDGVLGVLPGRPRQRLRAQARHRPRPRARLRRARRRARARDRRRRRGRRDVPRDRLGGLRLRRAGHRQRHARPARRADLRRTRRSARCAAGATRTGRSWSTARRTSFTGYSVAVANSGVFGGGMYLVPDASLDDGLLDVVLHRRAARSGATSRNLPQGVQGHARDEPRPHVPARRARSRSTPTARSRAYADGDPIADLPVTIRVVPRALKVLVP